MIQYLYLGRVAYVEGLRLQTELVELRYQGRLGNVLLLLEHPPVLTLGRNARRANVLASDELLARRGVTLHEINRGGDVTYHGPGQLVGYPIFDLRSLRHPNGGRLGPVDFVRLIEEALIRLCGIFGVPAGRIPGLTGVWCGLDAPEHPGSVGQGSSPDHHKTRSERALQAAEKLETEGGGSFNPRIKPAESTRGFSPGDASSGNSPAIPPFSAARLTPEGRPSSPGRKIGAIGIHVSRGITSHGFAFNVTTDLRDFALINPCGITDRPVTSLENEVRQREVQRPESLPALEAVAHQAARQFGQVFSEQVLAVESLDALRASLAPPTPQPAPYPAQDTPLQIPPEVERLRSIEDRPRTA
jgi:lipoyl(octanoyl) transferase